VIWLVNKKPSVLTFSLIAIFIAIMIFSTGNQTANARETLSVQIQPPSETTVLINTEVQLWANATGGSGEYYYRWSVNNVQINNNFTSATIILNETKVGTYTIGCQISDIKGVAPGTAIAPEINLFFTTEPLSVGQAPSNSQETSSNNQEIDNQGLTMIAVAVVVVSIVGAAIIILVKQRKPSNDQLTKT
jgi:hypothetical protein